MRESIGTGKTVDQNQDGVDDEAQASFEETSQIEPTPADATPARSHREETAEEGLMESAQRAGDRQAPGSSN